MPSYSSARALIPAALAGLFAGWCGTVVGGASPIGAVAAYGSVLLVGALGGDWRDPFRLGRRWGWLPWACGLVVPAGLWLSPVPRAGRVALVLLPAFLLLPSAVARCWNSPRHRRIGLAALAWVVAGVSLWSLIGRFLLGDARAARPIGHHGLMAVWLLALLPLVWRAARPPRTDGAPGVGRGRWVAYGALALAVAALLAGGSLVGIAGLVVQASMLSWALSWALFRTASSRRRARALLLVSVALAGCLVALWIGPRMLDIATGRDASLAARQVYWQAGLDGWRERPLLGWGVGATPWTLGLHLQPRAGITPPGQVVAELHNTPLQLLYEIGLVGTLLCALLGGVFLVHGRSGHPLARVGGAGLAGAAVALLGTGWWAILALPVALAIAAGACLPPSRPGRGRGGPWAPRIAWVYLCLGALVLSPGVRAHFALAEHPREAVQLDPQFPLYRAISAWEGVGDPVSMEGRAEDAVAAASRAQGIAVFWLTAGVYAAEAELRWAEFALLRACRLDPLGPMAPFHAMRVAPDSPWAARRGARTLLADPRLAAAQFWGAQPELFTASREAAIAWPGIDAGWREALSEQLPRSFEERGDLGRLAVRVDGSVDTSLSLRAFRRPLRPLWILPVWVGREGAARLALPPATTLLGNDIHRDSAECSEDVPKDSATPVEKSVENDASEGGSPRRTGG